MSLSAARWAEFERDFARIRNAVAALPAGQRAAAISELRRRLDTAVRDLRGDHAAGQLRYVDPLNRQLAEAEAHAGPAHATPAHATPDDRGRRYYRDADGRWCTHLPPARLSTPRFS